MHYIRHKVKGHTVLLDKEDEHLLQAESWHISGGYVRSPYATFLHHMVLPKKEGFQVDHLNQNKLDNRRCNLRYATHAQNVMNRKGHSKTGFKGVYHQRPGHYQASIRVKGKHISLGYYTVPEEAARAYDTAALEHQGKFACLNFPHEHP